MDFLVKNELKIQNKINIEILSKWDNTIKKKLPSELLLIIFKFVLN